MPQRAWLPNCLVPIAALMLIAVPATGLELDWELVTGSPGWGARSGLQAVVHDDDLWVLGGSTRPGIRHNDVWRTSDGEQWTQVTAAAPWAGRLNHKVVSFRDSLWIAGGNAGTRTNDVWRSTGGAFWVEVTAGAAWAERDRFSMVAYDNALWVMGGYSGDARFHDVWTSLSGADWTELTGDAGWSVRSNPGAVVFGGSMWITGGRLNGAVGSNDVWTTTDGTEWAEATAAAGWDPRYSHSVAADSNAMWLVGGRDDTTKNDVWFSENGEAWEQAGPEAAPWSMRSDHAVVIWNGYLWVLGGFAGSGLPDQLSQYSDVWRAALPLELEGEGAIEGEGTGGPACVEGVGHSADTDGSGAIGVQELLRVIQLFNAAGHQCAVPADSTEDGYALGFGVSTCCPHDADFDEIPDWRIGLTELLRVVQLYAVGGYEACPDEDTEDGFCPVTPKAPPR